MSSRIRAATVLKFWMMGPNVICRTCSSWRLVGAVTFVLVLDPTLATDNTIKFLFSVSQRLFQDSASALYLGIV